MTTQQTNDAQKAFDEKYITSGQILKEVKVTRAGLLNARRTGKLPAPIVVNDGHLLIWERLAIQPQLDAWKLARLGA
jgi:hypothetical protein